MPTHKSVIASECCNYSHGVTMLFRFDEIQFFLDILILMLWVLLLMDFSKHSAAYFTPLLSPNDHKFLYSSHLYLYLSYWIVFVSLVYVVDHGTVLPIICRYSVILAPFVGEDCTGSDTCQGPVGTRSMALFLYSIFCWLVGLHL